jgi:hypothetical protein
VIDTLRRQGWSWTSTSWAPDGTPAEFRRNVHGVSLTDGTRREIDIHWHVFKHCCRTVVTRELWERSVPFELAGCPTRALDPTDQLLLACADGPEYRPIPPLVWVADAVMILRHATAIDWDRVRWFTRRWRLMLPVRESLALLQDRFGAAVPASVLNDLEAAPVSWVEQQEWDLARNAAQSVWGFVAAVHARYRRGEPRQGLHAVPGFVRYMQYFKRLDTPWALAPEVVRWARRRVGRSRATLDPYARRR